jgi:hypothetical protein
MQIVGQFDGSGTDVLLQALQLPDAGNGHPPRLLGQQPGECDLCLIPDHDQDIVIDHIGQLGPDDSALVREILAANRQIGAVFTSGMAHRNATAVNHDQRGQLRENDLDPVGMGGTQPKQAGALWQARKPGEVVGAE